MSKGRLEAFSDAVFAVALTLLVFGLRLPNIANHSSLILYAKTMTPIIPAILSIAVTFAIICIHRVSHHYFFNHLKRVPLGIVWLNNILLLWICFMPFPAEMLGQHPTDQFPVLIFGINQLLAALTFFTLRIYAVRNKFLPTTI